MRPSEPIIDAQIEAYNSRDLEKFLTFYAPSILVYQKGVTEPLSSGIEALRKTYEDLFATSPQLNVVITDRKIEAPYVTDFELIKGMRGSNETIRATVRYRIENNKITEVVIARQ